MYDPGFLLLCLLHRSVECYLVRRSDIDSDGSISLSRPSIHQASLGFENDRGRGLLQLRFDSRGHSGGSASVAVRGTATADSEVRVYDNGTLVGSTYSMPNGQWSARIALHKPYTSSLHDLYAEVVTQDGKRLLTQSRTVDYDQAYLDLAKVTMVYNNCNIVFDHLNGKNSAHLTYYGNRPMLQDGKHKILPIIISAGYGVLSAGFERWLHEGQLDFWRRSFENDKARVKKDRVALENLLSAKCENGSLKIKDPLKLRKDKGLVDAWAGNSEKFFAAYKLRIDFLEQLYSAKFYAQSMFNVATSMVLGALGKFIPEISPWVNGGAVAVMELLGQSLGIGADALFTGKVKPEEAMANWFDVESKELTKDYIDIANQIKADYSDCKDDEEEEPEEPEEPEDKDKPEAGDQEPGGNNPEGGDEPTFPAPPTVPSIDPSGYVYEGVPSNRIAGVTATAYYKQQVEDMYGDITEKAVVWDAAPFDQVNPLITDDQGMYAWDVPAGMWQVRFEKEGYEPAQSEWLPVPPPQLDVNIPEKRWGCPLSFCQNCKSRAQG